MIIFGQKIIKDIDLFLPEILTIKESFNLIGQETQLTTPNQKYKSHTMQKIKSMDRFLPEILMIKEYCNMIGVEVF